MAGMAFVWHIGRDVPLEPGGAARPASGGRGWDSVFLQCPGALGQAERVTFNLEAVQPRPPCVLFPWREQAWSLLPYSLPFCLFC